MYPRVGDAATLLYPQDRVPYEVEKVSPARHKITLVEISTTGLAPNYRHNGFPVFDRVFAPDECAARKTNSTIDAYRRKDGEYYHCAMRVEIGQARYYRDHSE